MSEQIDLFGIMPDGEGEALKRQTLKKPNLTSVVTSTEARHAHEKGASGGVKPPAVSATKPSSASASKDIEKRPEYLRYKKVFCYAGQQIPIEDPALTLEQIRKQFEKVFPELSKERTEMVYQSPQIPKAKKAKTAKIPAVATPASTESDFDFSGEAKELAELDAVAGEGAVTEGAEVAEATAEVASEETGASEPVEGGGEDGEADAEQELSNIEEEWPLELNGVEFRGLVIPILKAAKKG